MTVALGSLMPIALEAVDIASVLVRNGPSGALTVKGDRDMATEVDLTIERRLRDFLRDKTPDFNFLGEEEGAAGRFDNELTWALDPIDGTANFIHGLPLCAISLGLVRDGRPVLGVIDLPFLGSRYTAIESEGAYKGARRLRASQTGNLQDAIVAIGDYAVGNNAEHKNRLRFALTEQLATIAQRVRMLGSAAVDLAWVAEGKLDASIILGNKPWDTAAGVLVAREAGAVVLDKDGSPHDFRSRSTVTAAPTLADDIMTLMREVNEGVFGRRPPTDSDTVISRTRYLLLDFDGAVCAGLTVDSAATGRLREVIKDASVDLPDSIADTDDPFDVLRYAATFGPDLAERVETEMTDRELATVPTAAPAPYIHELIAACQESGRTLAVVSNTSTRTINAYLTTHALDRGVDLVIGRTDADPATLTLNVHLITQAVTRLEADAAQCTLVTDSPASADAGRLAGVATIGYANQPSKHERLIAAGAEAIVTSLADLTLRLRSDRRPPAL